MTPLPFLLPVPNAQWSLIAVVCGQGWATGRTQHELTDIYRLPIHVYLRRSGCSAELANAIVRAFRTSFRSMLRDSPPPRGTAFRDYLRARLKPLVTAAIAPQDIGASEGSDLSELEHSYASFFPSSLSADQCFDRALGLGLIARALGQLRLEAIQTGHAALFELLQPFLAEDPPAGQYDVWAGQQNVSALAISMALRRLRQRFRELVDGEMMQSVGSGGAVHDAREAMRRTFKGPES